MKTNFDIFNMKNNCICVFDSGIGGLTLLKNLVNLTKGERYVYFGDNENSPYGNKTKDFLLSLTKKNLEYLKSFNPKIIVVACNTLTENCIDDIRKMTRVKVFGIEPAINLALREKGQSMLICTYATARSDKLKERLYPYKNKFVLCPQRELAKSIQENVFSLEQVNVDFIDKYKDITNIVLGCTHYTFLKERLKKRYPKIKILDGNEGTAKNVVNYLSDNGLLRKGVQSVEFVGNSKEFNKKVFESMK